jgi:DNA-directed RNA polymerase specialized sigma24 family protein
MPKPKIDKVKLNQLLRSGKSQREIAQVFDVTEGAISKAKKELNISVVKNVALENAGRIVDKNLNAIDQLRNINEKANGLLDSAIDSKDHDTAIKAMREIRNQLSLQLEIFQTLYDMKAVEEFQSEVLEAIGEASSDVRNAIINKLNKRQAIRSTIKFD